MRITPAPIPTVPLGHAPELISESFRDLSEPFILFQLLPLTSPREPAMWRGEVWRTKGRSGARTSVLPSGARSKGLTLRHLRRFKSASWTEGLCWDELSQSFCFQPLSPLLLEPLISTVWKCGTVGWNTHCRAQGLRLTLCSGTTPGGSAVSISDVKD